MKKVKTTILENRNEQKDSVEERKTNKKNIIEKVRADGKALKRRDLEVSHSLNDTFKRRCTLEDDLV